MRRQLIGAVRLRSLSGLFAVLLVISGSLIVPSASAQTFSFSRFDVVGNARINDSAILTYAAITPGSEVSGAQINDALQRLQNTGLFESVEITPRGNTLVITVQEYPTINMISIE